MTRAIKKHWTDFVAIIVLVVLAVAVSGYILHNEGLRFPFLQPAPFTMNADFANAQAVTPGQGQSVRVSGVQIGTISNVKLQNGYAEVQMAIQPTYKKLIHTNATALLRPRTGLQDMFVELNPGSFPSPVIKSGYTIPLGQTNPEVNVDEILSSLDADTRQYLQLLVNGAGQGLNGRGTELAQVMERFEPTHQDLARLNEAVAVRGADLRQLVNSLRRLNDALVAKRAQIVQMIDSSSAVFSALASEDSNISRSVADLPATLTQTQATLAKVQTFAQLLGPTATKLLPAANALPAANQALAALAKPSTPIIKNQIRPFVVAARPLVRNLEPASINLANATPSLTSTFNVLNQFFNLLGYNPTVTDSSQHGYLWWLAWLGHIGRTVFSVQDGNGDFRQAFLQLSCTSIAEILDGLPTGIGSTVLQAYNLVPILSDADLCPGQSSTILNLYKKYESSGGQSASSTASGAGTTGASDKARSNSTGFNSGMGSGSRAANGSTSFDGMKNLFLPTVPTH